VADGQMTLERLQGLFLEDVVDQPHMLVFSHPTAIGNGYAGAFLTPVLERIEAEISQLGGLGMSINAKNTALFPLARNKRRSEV